LLWTPSTARSPKDSQCSINAWSRQHGVDCVQNSLGGQDRPRALQCQVEDHALVTRTERKLFSFKKKWCRIWRQKEIYSPAVPLRLLASKELCSWTGFHTFHPLASVSPQLCLGEGISSKPLSLGDMYQSENQRTFHYQNLFPVWRHFENVYGDLLHFCMKSLS